MPTFVYKIQALDGKFAKRADRFKKTQQPKGANGKVFNSLHALMQSSLVNSFPDADIVCYEVVEKSRVSARNIIDSVASMERSAVYSYLAIVADNMESATGGKE